MLKDYLKKRLIEIRRHHEGGATGEQVIAALTDLTDEVIERIATATSQVVPLEDRWKVEDGLAVAALGGYGRGERSPYSDIDIMFLYRAALRKEIESIAGSILQSLWDVGFQVGHSTRTVEDCIAIGKRDLTARTSLMEARFLFGSRSLFDQFRLRFQRKVVQYRPELYARAKIRAREEECKEYGSTIHLLEPHIKKSRGGLRDIHLFRWLAQTRYQSSSLEYLKQQGILSKQDHRGLSEAQEFLWRIRNDLHFFAGRCQDVLTFDEQIRLASGRGYIDNPHLLGVEQFMQKYYDHTTAIEEITGSYIEGMVSKSVWRKLRDAYRSRTVGDYFIISGREISIRPEMRAEVLGHGDRVLSLLRLAQEHRVALSQDTVRWLTDRMEKWTESQFSDPESRSVFLSILSGDGNVARTLRDLHRFRILERILPAFKRVRGLMQFNVYHKYTVDEHSLRAVEEAESLLREDESLARMAGEIRRRDILFLAILLHDLGKGLGGDHSEEGASIALDAAQRLGFDPAQTEQLVFLVKQHLLMTHIAFRRDLADDTVLLQFAKTVAIPEALKMLYILTLADIRAVGPGTLTAWKRDLLLELFAKTVELLTGESVQMAQEERIGRVRELLLGKLGGVYDPDWLSEQLASMTPRYILATPAERIMLDLERVHELKPKSVRVFVKNDLERNLTEYSVYTFDDVTPGIFYKITSVLAGKGLQILDATITTWSNAVVVDNFQVQDPDYSGPPAMVRLRDVQDTVTRALLGEIEPGHGAWAENRIRPPRSVLPRSAPVQIEIDNSTSEKYTVIEVFAPDRTGLLSAIARSIFEQGLSVQTAKVATQLDQVVDIFHVVNQAGQKIDDPDRIRLLKLAFVQDIGQFLEKSRVQ